MSEKKRKERKERKKIEKNEKWKEMKWNEMRGEKKEEGKAILPWIGDPVVAIVVGVVVLALDRLLDGSVGISRESSLIAEWAAMGAVFIESAEG
jgi:hypothetical protein